MSFNRREDTRRATHVIDAIQDLMLVLDADAHIVYLSPSATRILGADPNQLLNQSCFTLSHPDDVEHLQTAIDFGKGQAPLIASQHVLRLRCQRDPVRAQFPNDQPTESPGADSGKGLSNNPAADDPCSMEAGTADSATSSAGPPALDPSSYIVATVHARPLVFSSVGALALPGMIQPLMHQLMSGFRSTNPPVPPPPPTPLPMLPLATLVVEVSQSTDLAPLLSIATAPMSADAAPGASGGTVQSPPTVSPITGAAAASSLTLASPSADYTPAPAVVASGYTLLIGRTYPLMPHDDIMDEVIGLQVENQILRESLRAKYLAKAETLDAAQLLVGRVLGQRFGGIPLVSVLHEATLNPMTLVRDGTPDTTTTVMPSPAVSDVMFMDTEPAAAEQTLAPPPLLPVDPAGSAAVGGGGSSAQYMPAQGHGSGLAGVAAPSDFIDAKLTATNGQPNAQAKRRKRSKPESSYVCMDCGTDSSPEWRKGPTGEKCLWYVPDCYCSAIFSE
ncbi:hypothetical protein BC828DRAFT_397014 [Blastocladiella britannica]|nr:hypothetical protein BC828DRAFT_397014 [Blastocladiella britannica]